MNCGASGGTLDDTVQVQQRFCYIVLSAEDRWSLGFICLSTNWNVHN